MSHPFPHPHYLAVGGGARFCLYHPPSSNVRLRGGIVYIHPFAEEMNFSRRMAALQSRALAAQGFAVLQIDLQGCGDSADDFSEASWTGWVADIVTAARWLASQHLSGDAAGDVVFKNTAASLQSPSMPLIFWGLRVGCLLAVEAARKITHPVDFLFWQPVQSGEHYWHQFQRLGVAAKVLADQNRGDDREINLSLPNVTLDQQNVAVSSADMAAEALLEIAGYRIAAELKADLCAAQFVLPENTRQVWCVEVDTWADSTETDKVSAKPAALSATLLRTVTAWQAQGVCVEANAVAGAAFWQVAEALDCTAMLEMTQRLLTGGDGVKNVAEILLDSINEEADSPARGVPSEKLARHGMALDSEGTRVFEASLNEAAVSFADQGQPMLGVVNLPAKPNETGVLILVGGRQYRAGSHRQFVHLARRLASADFSTFRFDFRGMGDSAGEPQSFEAMDADIAAALAAFKAHCPQIKRVVLWGLCDGATAAALYWQRTNDPFVAGLCLVNPWLRTEASLARARVKHYYLERLLEPAFWRKLLAGGIGLRSSISEYFRQRRIARRITSADFITQTLDGLRRFPGALLVVLSGRDLVAKEFIDAIEQAGDSVLLAHLKQWRQDIFDADHTFSAFDAQVKMEAAVLIWLQQMEKKKPSKARAE